MRVKSALASDGGGCTPIPFTISTITYKESCSLRSSWEGGYTPPISSLPLQIICDQKEGVGNLEFWPCMPYMIWVMIIRRIQVLYTSRWNWRCLQISSPSTNSRLKPVLASLHHKPIQVSFPLSSCSADQDAAQGQTSSLQSLWCI
jgi:hypothetical protein